MIFKTEEDVIGWVKQKWISEHNLVDRKISRIIS